MDSQDYLNHILRSRDRLMKINRLTIFPQLFSLLQQIGIGHVMYANHKNLA
jgi:hypothetical protein